MGSWRTTRETLTHGVEQTAMNKQTLKEEFMILLGLIVIVLGVIIYNGIREQKRDPYKPLRQEQTEQKQTEKDNPYMNETKRQQINELYNSRDEIENRMK
jgi:flagellar biosynthesis/type III secretory pathway M-ring protein FliF/YscJ